MFCSSQGYLQGYKRAMACLKSGKFLGAGSKSEDLNTIRKEVFYLIDSIVLPEAVFRIGRLELPW